MYSRTHRPCFRFFGSPYYYWKTPKSFGSPNSAAPTESAGAGSGAKSNVNSPSSSDIPHQTSRWFHISNCTRKNSPKSNSDFNSDLKWDSNGSNDTKGKRFKRRRFVSQEEVKAYLDKTNSDFINHTPRTKSADAFSTFWATTSGKYDSSASSATSSQSDRLDSPQDFGDKVQQKSSNYDDDDSEIDFITLRRRKKIRPPKIDLDKKQEPQISESVKTPEETIASFSSESTSTKPEINEISKSSVNDKNDFSFLNSSKPKISNKEVPNLDEELPTPPSTPIAEQIEYTLSSQDLKGVDSHNSTLSESAVSEPKIQSHQKKEGLKDESIKEKLAEPEAKKIKEQTIIGTKPEEQQKSSTASKSLASEALDPKSTSKGLLGHYRDSEDGLDRLLNFMSDDSIIVHDNKVKYPRGSKPSTRDRIRPGGERVIKEDLDIEELMPSEIRGRYSTKEKENPISEKPQTGSFSEISKESIQPKLESNTLSSEDESESLTRKASHNGFREEDIASLDEILGNARTDRIRSDNERFRQKNAYEYSREVYLNKKPRTLEEHNFFTPVYVDSFWSPVAKSRADIVKEYIILTPAQKIIRTNYRPFKHDKTTQDLFTTLSNLSKPEDYIKSIMKLEKQGWSIIGGGGPGNLVVFEREYNKKKRANWYALKVTLGSAGALLTLLVGLMAVVQVPTTTI